MWEKDALWRTVGDATVAPISTPIVAAMRNRLRFLHTRIAASITAAISETKLDWENDGSKPAQVIPSVSRSAVAQRASILRQSTSATLATIATTRNRP